MTCLVFNYFISSRTPSLKSHYWHADNFTRVMKRTLGWSYYFLGFIIIDNIFIYRHKFTHLSLSCVSWLYSVSDSVSSVGMKPFESRCQLKKEWAHMYMTRNCRCLWAVTVKHMFVLTFNVGTSHVAMPSQGCICGACWVSLMTGHEYEWSRLFCVRPMFFCKCVVCHAWPQRLLQ